MKEKLANEKKLHLSEGYTPSLHCNNKNRISRREFVAASAVAMAAGSLRILSGRQAVAAEMPQVDPTSAQAEALKYTNESEVDGSRCSNCMLYKGDRDADWGPCEIFPGRQVSTGGWCASWVQKTG